MIMTDENRWNFFNRNYAAFQIVFIIINALDIKTSFLVFVLIVKF